MEKLMNEFEASECLGVSLSFLRKDRTQGRRIPFIKLGSRILYSPEALRQYVASLMSQPEPQPAPTPPTPGTRRRGRPTKAEQLARWTKEEG